MPVAEGALGIEHGGAVVAGIVNRLADRLGLVRDDEKGLLLIAAVQRVQGLGRDKLIDDGIEGALPAEEEAGDDQDDDVEAEDQVPGLDAPLLREIDGDEVGAAAGGVHREADADRDAAENAAEDGDEQGIVGNDIRGQHIGQNAADHDQQQGQQGKLLPDIAEADIHRKGVERQVNRRVVGDEAQKLFAQALDQHRQARDAAGEQVRGTDKGLDRDCQQQGCEKDGEDAFEVPFPVKRHDVSSEAAKAVIQKLYAEAGSL